MAFVVTSGLATQAEAQAVSAKKASSAQQGPTMAETKAWIETEAPALMSALQTKLDKPRAILSSTIYRESEVRLDACALSWVTADSFAISSPVGKRDNNGTWHTIVPLKGIEVASTLTDDIDDGGGNAVQAVRIKHRALSTEPLFEEWKDGEPHKATQQAMIFVRNRDAGDRIAAAIRRAAILCGAPASPF